MTNDETLAVRKALRPRKTFDDYLAHGVQATGIIAAAYFGAHLLAYLIN